MRNDTTRAGGDPGTEGRRRARNAVWLPPNATAYSCLCESCLDLARGEGAPFLAAVRAACVRGRLPADTAVCFVRCTAGHEIVVRRDRPSTLSRPDARQLQIV
jgi:hypothetical protein